ncbi:hypothetical protein FACS1894218_3340 [Bacilli bacterium]|nr:hypothetical protein FACS1894218_3340 [Bacilli bacterium]
MGSIGIAIFTLPQLFSLIKTKNTAFINIPMYIIYLIGCFSLLIGGILILQNSISGGVPLVVAQGISGTSSSIIFIWKLKNYYGAKKAHMSELEYCKQPRQSTKNKTEAV